MSNKLTEVQLLKAISGQLDHNKTYNSLSDGSFHRWVYSTKLADSLKWSTRKVRSEYDKLVSSGKLLRNRYSSASCVMYSVPTLEGYVAFGDYFKPKES